MCGGGCGNPGNVGIPGACSLNYGNLAALAWHCLPGPGGYPGGGCYPGQPPLTFFPYPGHPGGGCLPGGQPLPGFPGLPTPGFPVPGARAGGMMFDGMLEGRMSAEFNFIGQAAAAAGRY